VDSTRNSYRLIEKTNGQVIASRVRRASALWERTVGLLGRRSLGTEEGLWIEPCNGIHTIGMRFSIDVIVLDRELRVLNIIHALKPFRIACGGKGARSVLELPAGTASSIRVGDQLVLIEEERELISQT
jgi:uncharacterized membrane protein (UPF0127 family)